MTLTRTATVFTTAGDGIFQLLSMSGTEAMGRPFEFELELLAEDESFDLSKLLGQPMLVTLKTSDTTFREFSGYVTRFSLAGELGRFIRYRATLRPWLWMLSRTTNCRIFQNLTVPQVLKAIFREYGFSDFQEELSNEYRTWEYLVQYRESDLNFVSRMLEQEGIYYYFRHNDSKHMLVLSDSYSAHDGVPGYATVPYFPPQLTERRERDHIDSWRAAHQITSGAFATTDYDFERPRASLYSPSQHPNKHAGAEYELYDYPGEFSDSGQGATQAKLRLEEAQTEYDLVQGAGNARGIHPGALVTLERFPRADQNKEYLVISCQYELRIDDYESIGTDFEDRVYRCRFTAIDARRPFRLPRSTPKPVVTGPQTAVVVGQGGQEIWTDKYGRVKVQFHWDRQGGFDENSSCWVRVAQLWAGSGWGGIHIPRIGQEVIVDFLEGDPDRPVITGRLYNADNMPPYDLPQNQTQSGIKSHSTKDGGQDNFNEIRFEDKKGEESVNIQAEKDMTTLVKNNQTNTIQASRSSSTGGSDSVSVGGDRSLSVTGNRTVTVTQTDTETYNNLRTVTVTGPDTLTITNAHIGNYNAARTVTIQGPDQVTVNSGGKANFVTGKYGHTATEEYEAKQGANVLNMKGSVAKLTNGKATITLDGGKVTIEAPEQIELKVGGNSVKIASGGTIDVTAASAATVTGAKASCALDGSGATVSGPKVGISGQSGVDVMGAMIKLN